MFLENKEIELILLVSALLNLPSFKQDGARRTLNNECLLAEYLLPCAGLGDLSLSRITQLLFSAL